MEQHSERETAKSGIAITQSIPELGHLDYPTTRTDDIIWKGENYRRMEA